MLKSCTPIPFQRDSSRIKNTKRIDSGPSPRESERRFQSQVEYLNNNVRKQIHRYVRSSVNGCSRAFKMFTTSETINFNEFHHTIVKKLGFNHLDLKTCMALFQTYDSDKSGDISYGEFIRAVFQIEEKEARLICNYNRPMLKQSTYTVAKGILPTKVEETCEQRDERIRRDRRDHASMKFGFPEVKEASKFARALDLFASSPSKSLKDFVNCFNICQIYLPPEEMLNLYEKYAVPRNSADQPERNNSRSPSPPFTPNHLLNPTESFDVEHMENIHDKWLMEDVENALRVSVSEGTQQTPNRLRESFNLFTSSRTICREDFRSTIRSLGIYLSEKNSDALFGKYDEDDSNDLDYREFCNLMDGQCSYRGVGKTTSFSTIRNDLVGQPVFHLDQIEKMIRDKIEQKTERSCDSFHQALKCFGKGRNLSMEDFKTGLERISIELSDAGIQELFNRYDVDGTGFIDLEMFASLVLQRGFRDKWVPEGEVVYKNRKRMNKALPLRSEVENCQTANIPNWTIEQIESCVREKIESKTPRSSKFYEGALRIFKKAKGITSVDFQTQLRVLGISLTDNQAQQLLERYDTRKKGCISLAELVYQILPEDYSKDNALGTSTKDADGKLWDKKRGPHKNEDMTFIDERKVNSYFQLISLKHKVDQATSDKILHDIKLDRSPQPPSSLVSARTHVVQQGEDRSVPPPRISTPKSVELRRPASSGILQSEYSFSDRNGMSKGHGRRTTSHSDRKRQLLAVKNSAEFHFNVPSRPPKPAKHVPRKVVISEPLFVKN